MGTIFALSSGRPPAAIAIVRISGRQAGPVVRQLAGKIPQPRRSTVAALHHPRTGELLDKALLLWLPGPASATGEDLTELHLHGGRAVVDGVLEALREMPGLRQAEPGEFTRRALHNGRIDLNQAEGLADLLAAETQQQRRSALLAVGGGMTRCVEGWRTRLIDIAATIEAAIDFPEEEDVLLAHDFTAGARDAIGTLAGEMARALAGAPSERLRDGVRVVVAGPPNSGKSSLVNALCGREVAITSSVAGTTRDVIEVPISFDGVPILLIDTAGLRPVDDVIEAAGVARARQQIQAGDIVVWLDDAPFDLNQPHVHVYSRCDIRAPQRDRLPVSAVTGQNLVELRSAITAAAKGLLPAEGEMALNRRQREAVRSILELLKPTGESEDLILLADNVRAAIFACDRFSGRSGTEDMLDALFGRFCIGK